MKKRTALLMAGLCLMGLSACSKGSGHQAFERLASTEIIAGERWGDLVLGETTLAEVVKRYGHQAEVMVNLSDETSIEVHYAQGQIQLIFALDEAASAAAHQQQPQWYKLLSQNLNAIDQMPAVCQQAPLSSLSLAPGTNSHQTLFTGQTDHGLGFWQALEISPAFFVADAMMESRCCKVRAPLAGAVRVQQQKLVPLTAWIKPGLLVYTAPDYQQLAQGIESQVKTYLDSAQSPADQARLKEQANALGQDARLARITIFEPRAVSQTD